MTQWQWSVFKAFMRYSLSQFHYEFLIDYRKDLKKQDIDLIAEALKRETPYRLEK